MKCWWNRTRYSLNNANIVRNYEISVRKALVVAESLGGLYNSLPYLKSDFTNENQRICEFARFIFFIKLKT